MIIHNDEVIANASTALMSMTINGRYYHAVQISTVMTSPEWKGKGLAKKLVSEIINKHKSHYDFLYLFANENALDFYPKFDFNRIHESEFLLKNVKPTGNSTSNIRKINLSYINDLKLIEFYSKKRLPISNTLGANANFSLSMFSFIYLFEN